MDGQVQIIGGMFKGKKIHFPLIPGLRPTPNRIKETLFNWLMFDIRQASCLDAFAGSGSLGFEALSRGAKQVVMVEEAQAAFNALKKTAQSLNPLPDQLLNIYHAEIKQFLNTCSITFDIIFLDPPFSSHYLDDCLSFLAHSPCLPSKGLIYVETPHPPLLDENLWKLRKSKKASQVYYSLFEKLLT